jgi:uncharacterized protein YndB with AHSA1/START domain
VSAGPQTSKSVAAERTIDAPAPLVYRLISDFNLHHANILPSAFRDLRVESGSGVGAGTVITFQTTNGGRVRRFRSEVSEPEPGRVLVEEDRSQGARTTFTVTPDGDRSVVRIENTFVLSPGITGLFERLLAPGLLRRLLVEELARLDAYAASQPRG